MKHIAVLTIASAVLLSGCATGGGSAPPVAQPERLSIAVGACYGTCPVYTVTVGQDGTGQFDGKEHVATQGVRSFRTTPATYGSLIAALKPFRPTTGSTAQTQCTQQVSDQPTYVITWTADGGGETVLNHDRGCFSTSNRQLNEVLEQTPDKLGIRPLIGR